MAHRPFILSLLVASAAAAFVVTAVNGAPGRTTTLRFYDKPVSITLTRADGTVVRHAPYPRPKDGDTLDVVSLDYQGNHARHAKDWSGSSHLRCVFLAAPTCTSHVAFGDSMLIFTGSPGKLVLGTGIYAGATGRVVSSKEVPGGDNATDIVAKIQLHGSRATSGSDPVAQGEPKNEPPFTRHPG